MPVWPIFTVRFFVWAHTATDGSETAPNPSRSACVNVRRSRAAFMCPPLLTLPASVDVDRLAGEVTRLIGGKERDHRADLAGLPRSAERDLRQDDRQNVGRLHHPLGHVRVDETRMDAVDPDTERRHLRRHVTGERLE